MIYSGTSGWVATTVDRLHLDLGNLIGALVGADPTTYNYIAEVETSGKSYRVGEGPHGSAAHVLRGDD